VTEHRHQRDEFIAAASRFCELFENAEGLGRDNFLLGLERVLPRLQAAAVELPYPDDSDQIPDDDLDVRLTDEERNAFASPVSDILEQIPWKQVQEELSESVAVKGSPAATAAFLHDDLSDIYADLKEPFRLIEAGRPEAEAVFYWRLTFWSHWGYHNAEALRVVHSYVAQFLEG
jgi:hypothetical protein